VAKERPRILLGALSLEQILRLAERELEIPIYDAERLAERESGEKPVRPYGYVVLSAAPEVRSILLALLNARITTTVRDTLA